MPRPSPFAAIAGSLLTIAVAAPFAARAQNARPEEKDSDSGRLTLSTDRLVVFKDGYTLVVKSATAIARPDGSVYTDQVPAAAVLGCFWAAAENVPVTSMRAEWVEEVSERSTTGLCVDMVEILRANVGQTVTVVLNAPLHGSEDGSPAAPESGSVTGVIARVLEHPPEPRRPFDPDLLHLSPEDRAAQLRVRALAGQAPTSSPELRGEVVRPLVPSGANLVEIEEAGGQRLVLPIANVRAVRGATLTTTMTRREEVTDRRKRLTFELGTTAKDSTGRVRSPSEPVRLSIMYFTPGVRWIPTYRIGGGLETDALVTLQAEILNELENVDGAALDLVVGVPSFRFKGVISPMSLERELRNALAQAAPQLMGQQQMSNAMFSRRSSEFIADASPDSGPVIAPELLTPGSGEQDLFVYSVADGREKKFSLAKGARATLPLWEHTVPIRHLYTMDVTVKRNQRRPDGSYSISSKYDARFAAVPPSPESPLELRSSRVWHQLELDNVTAVPWTTGAAMLLRGHVPLGQDMLTYTPTRGRALLPVTVAVDVQGRYDETEVSRRANELSWSGATYALVRKRATITLTNYRDRPSALKVTYGLGGKVLEASDDAVVVLDDFHADDWGENVHDYRPNNHSDVTWELTLDAGSSITLAVEFELYVR